MTATAGELHRAEHDAPASPNATDTCGGRRVEREHEHVSPLPTASTSRRRGAAAHETPDASNDTDRSSSSSPASRCTSSRSAGSNALTRSPHSTTVDRVARPRGRRTRDRAAPAGGRAGRRRRARAAAGASYSRTMVNVGLTTGSVMPSATAMPLVNTVLPAPSSPSSTTTSPARSTAPTRAAERVGLVGATRAIVARTFIARRVARERALDDHEVGARLGQRRHRRCASTADGCSAGMSTASVAERELAAAQLGDAVLGARAAAWWRSSRASPRPAGR